MNIYSLREKSERQRFANHGANLPSPKVSKEGKFTFIISFDMTGREFFLELTLPEIQDLKNQLHKVTTPSKVALEIVKRPQVPEISQAVKSTATKLRKAARIEPVQEV